MARSRRLQRGEYILDQVVRMLEPAREPHQPITDAEVGARGRRKALVGRGCRVSDQALGVAEIVADAHELERVLEAKCGGLAAFDLEGHERRTSTHLPAHDLRLWMVRS